MVRKLIATAVIAILGCLALLLAVDPWPVPPMPTPIVVTATPTTAPTVTTFPDIVTPTVTSTPQVVVTVEVITPDVPVLGTPTQEPKTPSTETPAVADNCRHGVITAHAAISQVLATKPERACDGCTYYASVMCQDIGKRMELRIPISISEISIIPVSIVDCATWTVGAWPQKNGLDWLGELDIRSWPNMPLVPLEAALCD